ESPTSGPRSPASLGRPRLPLHHRHHLPRLLPEQQKSPAPAPRSLRHRFTAASAISMLPRTAATQIQELKLHLGRTFRGPTPRYRLGTASMFSPARIQTVPTSRAVATRRHRWATWSIAVRS